MEFFDKGARTPVLGISPGPRAHSVLDKTWASGAARSRTRYRSLRLDFLCDEPLAVDTLGSEAVVLGAVGLEVALIVTPVNGERSCVLDLEPSDR